MKKSLHVTLVSLLIVGLNATGLFAIGEALAAFNDTEESVNNAFTAGSLDFSLDPIAVNEEIYFGEDVTFSSNIIDASSLIWKYTLEAEKISGSDTLCDTLELTTSVNGIEQYNGAAFSLNTEATSTDAAWDFYVSLPAETEDVTDGDSCEMDIIFKGWQVEIPSYEESGFFDEERLSITLTARETHIEVVLNEFLPNPNGFEYGFDFGEDRDDMPQGEWVELYNKSAEPVDLTGWYIEDANGGARNTIYVTSGNTDPATTTIGGTSWLVVYMNKPLLNNTGDTVKLFNASGTLVDSHEYVSNDYCDLEPTPGDPNNTEPSGSCRGVPPNKSYARIPDGTGEWVDPIPTPGRTNKLTEPDQKSTSEEPVEEETTNTVFLPCESIGQFLQDFVPTAPWCGNESTSSGGESDEATTTSISNEETHTAPEETGDSTASLPNEKDSSWAPEEQIETENTEENEDEPAADDGATADESGETTLHPATLPDENETAEDTTMSPDTDSSADNAETLAEETQ